MLLDFCAACYDPCGLNRPATCIVRLLWILNDTKNKCLTLMCAEMLSC